MLELAAFLSAKASTSTSAAAAAATVGVVAMQKTTQGRILLCSAAASTGID